MYFVLFVYLYIICLFMCDVYIFGVIFVLLLHFRIFCFTLCIFYVCAFYCIVLLPVMFKLFGVSPFDLICWLLFLSISHFDGPPTGEIFLDASNFGPLSNI